MSAEIAAVLQDIAESLRRRVAQHDAAIDRVRTRPPRPDASIGSGERLDRVIAASDAHRESERAFRGQLLALLERHNALIERLIEQTIGSAARAPDKRE